MKIAWYNTIQTKLITATIVVTTVILGAFTGYNAYTERQRMQQELNTLAEVVSKRLTRQLVTPMWDLDELQVQESLASEMQENKVYGLLVRDVKDNAIFQGKVRNQNWEPVNATSAISSASYVVSREDIARQGERIGMVEVYITDRFLQEEFMASLIYNGIQAIVLMMTLSLMLYFALRSMVIKPVTTLTAVADKMSTGDLSVTIDLPSTDEIGQVGQALRRLQTSLRLAMDRLRNTN